MSILGTSWWPSVDPVGGASIAAGIIIISSVLLTSRIVPLECTRRICMILAPPAFLFVLAFTEGSLVFHLLWYHVRSFPDASDFIAGYGYMAFGFGFGMAMVRKGVYLGGMVATLVYAVLIVASGVLTAERGGEFIRLGLVVAVVLFGVGRSFVLFLRGRRSVGVSEAASVEGD